MISNTPWNRSRRAKAKLYANYPDDLRPSPLRAPRGAHWAPSIEFALPLALILTEQGHARHDRGDRDDRLPRPHHLDVPARRAAGVEPLHDLRDPVPLRALRRRAAVDARRPAADRVPAAQLRAAPDRRQLPAGQGLVPAVDALLRRQLGDQPVAVPQGHAAPRRSSTARRSRSRRRSWSSSWHALYDRETRRAAARQGARLPLDALARPRAQRAGPRGPSTTSRTTTCARASSSPGWWPAGTSATATSTTGSCSRRSRSAAASARRAADRRRSSRSPRTRDASTTGSTTRRAGLIEEGYVRVADMVGAAAVARREAATSRSR